MSIYEHLKSRHVDLDLHKVYLDYEEHKAVFPFHDLSGHFFGYQAYSPFMPKQGETPKTSKYFTYSRKGYMPYWGIESLNLSRTLFLTEGIFDACRLTQLGYSALAVLTNDPKPLKGFLDILTINRRSVAICDFGSAGFKLAKYGKEYHVMPEEYDLGDAPDEYVKTLIKSFK